MKTEIKLVPNKIYEAKTSFAAWLEYHCLTPSQREVYVTRMSKVEKVHVYGLCGVACGNNTTHENRFTKEGGCLYLVNSKYKFYLAFENTFCKDYISEKNFFFFQTLQRCRRSSCSPWRLSVQKVPATRSLRGRRRFRQS